MKKTNTVNNQWLKSAPTTRVHANDSSPYLRLESIPTTRFNTNDKSASRRVESLPYCFVAYFAYYWINLTQSCINFDQGDPKLAHADSKLTASWLKLVTMRRKGDADAAKQDRSSLHYRFLITCLTHDPQRYFVSFVYFLISFFDLCLFFVRCLNVWKQKNKKKKQGGYVWSTCGPYFRAGHPAPK